MVVPKKQNNEGDGVIVGQPNETNLNAESSLTTKEKLLKSIISPALNAFLDFLLDEMIKGGYI